MFHISHRCKGVVHIPGLSTACAHASMQQVFALVNSSQSEGMSLAILEVCHHHPFPLLSWSSIILGHLSSSILSPVDGDLAPKPCYLSVFNDVFKDLLNVLFWKKKPMSRTFYHNMLTLPKKFAKSDCIYIYLFILRVYLLKICRKTVCAIYGLLVRIDLEAYKHAPIIRPLLNYFREEVKPWKCVNNVKTSIIPLVQEITFIMVCL